MNPKRETFDKSERLCSRKTILELVENGNIFYNSLFKVVWDKRENQDQAPARVAFSVSKKGFRLAVTRNLIKRRMREAYRRNKSELYNHLLSQNIQIVFLVIIRGNSVPDYLTIQKSVRDIIEKLMILTAKTK